MMIEFIHSLPIGVSYNNTNFLVKRTSNFVFLTLQKDDKGDFHIVE